MTDAELKDLARWIQSDLSGLAQRVREVLSPPVRELARIIRQGEHLRYTAMPWLEPPMRRKIRRYARSLNRERR